MHIGTGARRQDICFDLKKKIANVPLGRPKE